MLLISIYILNSNYVKLGLFIIWPKKKLEFKVHCIITYCIITYCYGISEQ
jgi:hypothetical protein